MTYPRALKPPERTFFLFAPRGTGKTTWLRQTIQADLWIDLLKSDQFLKYGAEPSRLRDALRALKPASWVVVDEIQKVPLLLDEVHWAYENLRLRFALTGSSARKLKRSGANLLAGRAVNLHLFPLTSSELGKAFGVEQWIEWGSLPLVATTAPASRPETLSAYVENYLRQELIEEGIIRKLDPFVRFLAVAGRLNGQVLNLENVARESHVKRPTVEHYFSILEETLIATRLRPYVPGHQVKEVAHPKLYFFDAGVARAAAGYAYEPLESESRGFALETGIFNELKAYNFYSRRNKPIFYYATHSSGDIDFVVETRPKSVSMQAEAVCIEVKHSRKWDRRWCRTSDDFAASGKTKVGGRYGVYLGEEILSFNGMRILPLRNFLALLHTGGVF